MTMLILGVLLWSVLHLVPSALVAPRARLVDSLGANAYRGVFSLAILASILLMVFGWKSATPGAFYAPPLFGSPVIAVLLFVTFVMFVASGAPGHIRRYIRHPQMTAVILWSAAHLLANGDSRSLVLFGGLGLWAVLEIVFINRRDGAWQRPDSGSIGADAISLVAGAVIFATIAYFHGSLFGPSLTFAA